MPPALRLSLLLVLLSAPAEAGRPRVLDAGFRRGIAVDHGISAPSLPPETDDGPVLDRLRELKAAGLDHVRIELPMVDTLDIATRGADHRAVQFVDKILATGLNVIVVVGVGSETALPDGLHADRPDYLAEVTGNVGDITRELHGLVTRKYRKRPSAIRYQIENEINAAGLATTPFMNWRRGRRWWSLEFKARVLEALDRTVKQVDRDAVTVTNVSDLFWDSPDLLGLSASTGGLRGWLGRIASTLAWLPRRDRVAQREVAVLARHVDMVGVDLYPNYILPYRVTRLAGGVVRGIGRLVGRPNLSLDRLGGGVLGTSKPLRQYYGDRLRFWREASPVPIYVAETGTASSGLLHDPRSQAEFVRDAMRSPALRETSVTYFRLFDFVPGSRRAPQTGAGNLLYQKLDPNKMWEPVMGVTDASLGPKPVRRTLRERLSGKPAAISPAYQELLAALRAQTQGAREERSLGRSPRRTVSPTRRARAVRARPR
jgi:hypothetical protein